MQTRDVAGFSLRTLLLTTVALIIAMLGWTNHHSAELNPPTWDDRPTKAERLIAKHGCYTGSSPTGQVPTRAVVTLKDGRTIIDDAEASLQHLFGGVDYGITVHAFCD